MHKHSILTSLMILAASIMAAPSSESGEDSFPPSYFKMATHHTHIVSFDEPLGPANYLAVPSIVANVQTSTFQTVEPSIIRSQNTTGIYGITSLSRNRQGHLYAATTAAILPIASQSRNLILRIDEDGAVIDLQPFGSPANPTGVQLPPGTTNLHGISFDRASDRLLTLYQTNAVPKYRIAQVNSDGTLTDIAHLPTTAVSPGGGFYEIRGHSIAARCDGLIFVLATASIVSDTNIWRLYVYDGSQLTPVYEILLDGSMLPPFGTIQPDPTAHAGTAGDLHFDNRGELWFADGGLPGFVFFAPSRMIGTIQYSIQSGAGTLIPRSQTSGFPPMFPQPLPGLSAITSCLPADIDGSGVVGFDDLNILLASFGDQQSCHIADISGDGSVDFLDMNLLLASLGQACD